MQLSELPFEPLGTTSPGPATGFTVNGVDLANLYAVASTGTPANVVTGFQVAGTDIGLMFAAVGSGAKLTNNWASEYSVFEQGPDIVTAIVALTFKPDGTVTTPYGEVRWLAANLNSADYEIIATPTSGTFTENMMVAYAQMNTNRLLSKTLIAGPSAGFEETSVTATITIRRIAEPAEFVTGSVLFVANAASYGSGAPP